MGPISYSPGRRTAPVRVTEGPRAGTWIRMPSSADGFWVRSPPSSKLSRSTSVTPLFRVTWTRRRLPRDVTPPASRITSCSRRRALTANVPGRSTSPDSVTSNVRGRATASVTFANRNTPLARAATRRWASSSVRPPTRIEPSGGKLIAPVGSTNTCERSTSSRPAIWTSSTSPGPSRYSGPGMTRAAPPSAVGVVTDRPGDGTPGDGADCG